MRPVLNIPPGVGADAYSAALEGLTGLDLVLLRDDPSIPKLYESGVRYKLERPAGPDHPRQEWRTPREMMKKKTADCKNLAAWRAAELRKSGEDPTAYVIVYQTGPESWHAAVSRDGGRWREDPSRRLGMGLDGGNRLQGARLGGAFIGAERSWIGADASSSDQISWTVERTPRGWLGTVRIPLMLLHPDGGTKALFVQHEAVPPPKGAAAPAALKLPGMAPAPALKPAAAPTGNNAVLSALQSAAGVADNPLVKALLPGPAAAALDLVAKGGLNDIAKGAGSVASKIFSLF